MQDFIIPAAIPIMATGMIRMAPPTNSRKTISMGRASTMRIPAMIFAMPPGELQRQTDSFDQQPDKNNSG